jgi:hypothetical protein
MSTTIDRLESEVLEQQDRATHALALLTALAPDPSKWEYRGECFDGGEQSKCACGHPIRWEFPIYRENEVKVVGSTCVNHFAALNPTTGALMLSKLAELEDRLAAAKKAAKAAARQVEVDAARVRFEATLTAARVKFDSYRARGVKAPWELWRAVASYRRVPSKAPEYSRACDYIRWYKQETARLERAMENHE